MGAATTAVAGVLVLPGGPAAPDTATISDTSADVALYTGGDWWGEGVAPTGEARASAATRRTLGAATWSGGYALLLQGWTEPFWADAHVLQLEANTPGRHRLGGVGTLRASGRMGWAEATLGATGSFRLPAQVQLNLQAGPTVRGEAEAAGLGLAAVARATRILSPRATVSLRVDARGWRGEDLVPSTLDADLSASWAPRPGWTLWGDLGWSRLGGNHKTPYWAGLPGGGGHYGRVLGAVTYSLWRGLGIAAEVRYDELLLADGGSRLRAVLGVTGRLGRIRGPAPNMHDPTGVWFEVVVPGATEVVLVASFRDWEPIQLEPTGPDRWAVELPVPPGEHEYLYLVDGEPYVPPDAALLRPDGFGGANVVLLVGPDG